ncbi:beta-glucosidase BglX [Sphingomonas sp. LaA6.9]|uniref:beta-glucosidase BglX n=1 Tax=Sphingomonas sp. LaA6.9 TaxID=2919914 RepID=UPI001F4FAA3B|nr:beta-glucosidase BglX [Sphingomonas sp. LaA6.9]MCJ8156437.1 beta-glucosidase BglX [Sphingomonas sp. LaA6.9]
MKGKKQYARQLLGVCTLALLCGAVPAHGQSQDARAKRAATAQKSDPAPTGQNWNDPAEMHRFIDALMAKMTVKEKIGQLTQLTSSWESTGPTMRDSYKQDIAAGNVGSIFNAFTAKYTRELQKVAVEQTRLRIPLLFGYDVIHGHRTIFPISLGEAATWDMAAVEKGARISAVEAAAEGIHWTFSPMVDIARDPRWGRISEGSGEDVYLGSQIAAARVHGYQGKKIGDLDSVLATAKHFAAYGAAQAGRDYHTTDMSERELRDTYLPPFKAALDAGAATFMTSFNELNGVPATGSKFLLTDILRGEWGFKGFVVTDYTAINEMVPHGYARDEAQAGEQAMNAGVDMDMQGAVFMTHLEKSIAEGRVSQERVDQAVRSILEMKYRLGLFQDPYRYSDEAREKATIYKPEHLEAARDVARKSMVLLKNQGDVLPLAASAKSIAVIGPLGDSKEDMIGSWAAAGDRKTRPVTLLEGLRARAGKGVNVGYARGAGYRFDEAGKTDGFAEALALAQKSDVIIAAMGERWDMTGEAASRTDLDMPGAQQALLEELKKLGKPVVLVLMNGRPLTIDWAAENVDAILEAWYPGTMGGHAIADILFGDYNPSGKLPVTFPRTVGQVPIFYNMKNTGRPYTADKQGQKYLSRYLNTPNSPLYPFGYGLSYTSFGYSPVTIDKKTIRPGEALTASVTVTNTGKRDGEEVVQLYVRDLVGSVTRPVRELKGFLKVKLKRGESRKISFTLSDKDLAFHRADMSYGAEPGDFSLFVGGSSDATAQADFTLTK